jgi:hypothetical protein
MYGKTQWNEGLTKENSEILRKAGEKFSERIKNGEIDTSNMWKISEDGKRRISEFQKNRPKSEETKRKLSEALKGRKRDPESIKKTADKLRGRKQKTITCPHCGKSGGTTMYRWHFDNCKLRSRSR